MYPWHSPNYHWFWKVSKFYGFDSTMKKARLCSIYLLHIHGLLITKLSIEVKPSENILLSLSNLNGMKK